MGTGRIYFDYNATAPLRPAARAAMLEALDETGNASSVHAEGRAAHARIEAARAEVARLAGSDVKLITFTSGGTEANNTVLTPDWVVAGEPCKIDRLLTGATEHPSVLAGGRFPPECISQIPVDRNGVVDIDALNVLLGDGDSRALVSVMMANNETGVIQPVKEIAAVARAAGARVHTDAIQAAGRVPVDICDLGVDVLTLSAHKIGGPQGVGAIVSAAEDAAFVPILTGGGQERRTRAGTENAAAISGFGVAARLALADLDRADEWSVLRDKIAAAISASGREATVFSADAPRLPQTLCFSVAGTSAETLVIALDLAGVAVSSGSACSSGKVAPSHVLAAMGVPSELAQAAIRISLGWDSKESDLDMFLTAWRDVLKHVKSGENQAA